MSHAYGNAPLIIVGMHRSGTSMLCKILGDLGVFFGADQTAVNHESAFFVQINRWLFEQCGAAWDRPLSVREFFAHDRAYEVGREYVAAVLQSGYATGYLGARSKRGVFALDKPWGWKDPRTTYTLPLWLELFPHARVLHVIRNGIDVAQSLKVREEQYLDKRGRELAGGKLQTRALFSRNRLSYRKMPRLTMSLRCLSLDGGFTLWEEYMEEAQSHMAPLERRAMEVCYEQFLQNPREILAAICAFCGIAPHPDRLAAAVKGVRSDRANAYTADPVLTRFAAEHQSRLARFGY